MNLCPKGCGRPAKVRGYCRNHYNVLYKYEINRARWRRYSAVGTARRIRALVAIGYSQNIIGQQCGIGPSYISKLANGKRELVNATTAERVAALYDRLSMTPGPSRVARDWAHRKGWMPPLAWDDDTINDPDAQPDPGHQERIGFTERFTELREMGYSDLVIADRWHMRPEALLRQLHRYDITPDPSLTNEATQRKSKRAS